MKKLMSVLLLSTFSFSVFAEPPMPFLSTSAPSIMVTGCLQSGDETTCGLAQASVSVSTSTSLTLVLLKEEARQVEPDAYAFLAGEDMTLALGEVLEKARFESEELALRSDQELVSTLLDSIN